MLLSRVRFSESESSRHAQSSADFTTTTSGFRFPVHTGVDPEATGRPSYHPSVLLKLYIYSYLNRVQSSRRLERKAGRNVGDVAHGPPCFQSQDDCLFLPSCFHSPSRIRHNLQRLLDCRLRRRRCRGEAIPASTIREVTPQHRLEQHHGAQRRQNVHPGYRVKNGGPGAGRLRDEIADRDEQRGDAFRTIEHAVDAAEILRSEGIPRGSAEQAVDLTPGEEDDTAQEDEGPWIAAERGERGDAEPFQHEGHEHRVLAPDIVGHNAEQRPRDT